MTETDRTEQGRKVGQAIVCVDFDGVIHGYQSGWKGACVIPDPPVRGAMEWLANMTHDPRFDICIYSSRSKEEGAIDAMKMWLSKHLVDFYTNEVEDLDPEEVIGATRFVMENLQFPTQKPAAMMTIDDRAFCFQGTFPTEQWLLEFKPWNKK